MVRREQQWSLYSSAVTALRIPLRARRGWRASSLTGTLGMETGWIVISPDGYCTVLARLGPRGSRCVPSARSPAQFIRVSPDCTSTVIGAGSSICLTTFSTRCEALIPAQCSSGPALAYQDLNLMSSLLVRRQARLDHCRPPKREHNPAGQWEQRRTGNSLVCICIAVPSSYHQVLACVPG